jgi:DNA-binding protein
VASVFVKAVGREDSQGVDVFSVLRMVFWETAGDQVWRLVA